MKIKLAARLNAEGWRDTVVVERQIDDSPYLENLAGVFLTLIERTLDDRNDVPLFVALMMHEFSLEHNKDNELTYACDQLLARLEDERRTL